MSDIKVAFMHSNLNQITGFHNHVHGFFNDNLRDSQNADDITNGQKNWLKSEYEVHLPNQLRKSVFLMMFGHLEEHLHLTWVEAGKPDNLFKRKFGLTKYKRFFTESLGIDVGSNKDYQFITDSQLVRNSIIHIAGRVSLSKDEKLLLNAINRNKTYFEQKNDRVYITNDGIVKFQQSVARFTETVAKAI